MVSEVAVPYLFADRVKPEPLGEELDEFAGPFRSCRRVGSARPTPGQSGVGQAHRNDR